MNKRIYYRDKFIEFTGGPAQPAQNQSLDIITKTSPGPKVIEPIIDEFLAAEKGASFRIVKQDFKKTIALIKPRFHYIEAAGGFIEKDGQYLFIYRHDRWDLPKGKREKNESAEQCAVRECEEECGIKKLVILKKMQSTWHIYAHKGGFALKKTFWFGMSTTYNGKLVPQLDEDIREARWMRPEEVESVVLKNTYYTIADVVAEALNR